LEGTADPGNADLPELAKIPNHCLLVSLCRRPRNILFLCDLASSFLSLPLLSLPLLSLPPTLPVIFRILTTILTRRMRRGWDMPLAGPGVQHEPFLDYIGDFLRFLLFDLSNVSISNGRG